MVYNLYHGRYNIEYTPRPWGDYLMYEFEYDPNKSSKNKEKHKICFEEAQKLWSDEDGIELEIETETEPRFYKIAFHNKKCWTAIFAKRDGKVRLISVRRARKKEGELYEQEKNNSRGIG